MTETLAPPGHPACAAKRVNIVELSRGTFAAYRGTHMIRRGTLHDCLLCRNGGLPELPRLPHYTTYERIIR